MSSVVGDWLGGVWLVDCFKVMSVESMRPNKMKRYLETVHEKQTVYIF